MHYHNETREQKRERASKIVALLKKNYPQAKIVLRYHNPWQLLVAVILSAQCTDERVNKVTEMLFKKYQKAKFVMSNSKFAGKIKPEIQEIINYALEDRGELEEDIRPTGFYKNKAKFIQESAQLLLEQFGGVMPDTIEQITKLPGVARKTGHIVIGNTYGAERVEGIAVDTHVHRLSQRLRLVELAKIGGKPRKFKRNGEETVDFHAGANTDRIEQQLMEIIPRQDWFQITYLLIDHGRAVCNARTPDCPVCPLNHLCPAARL